MPSPSQPRMITISTGTILRTILVLIGLGIAWLIRDILLYVFIAMLLAGVIYPFAAWAARHRIPKGLAVFAFYIIMFGLVALAVTLLVPALLHETKAFLNVYGYSFAWLDGALQTVKTWTDQFRFNKSLSSGFVSFEQLQETLKGFVDFVSNVFGGLAGFVIVVVLSFYMVVEDQAMKGLFRDFIPSKYQEFLSQLVWQIMEKLGGWLRGQLILGLIIGALYFIGFSIIGVPYALLLAILGGLLEFIPYVGPFIAAVPAIYLALTDSPMRALMALILIVVIQQLENNVIVPKVMQKTVGLNPIVSIIAFMIGAKLFGVVGAIFAIPVATATSVVIAEIIRFRREQNT